MAIFIGDKVEEIDKEANIVNEGLEKVLVNFNATKMVVVVIVKIEAKQVIKINIGKADVVIEVDKTVLVISNIFIIHVYLYSLENRIVIV